VASCFDVVSEEHGLTEDGKTVAPQLEIVEKIISALPKREKPPETRFLT
jgi:hypothetical protein